MLGAASFKGKPLMLNFWATWCPPCVEELPLLNAFFNENKAKGWQVLGLAVDQAEPVRRFLTHSPLEFPVALAGFPGMEISKSLGNFSSGLPFTVLFNSDGAVVHRKMGRVSPDELQVWALLPV
jgi:thiol-disulfide isomerase/thioredoxin